MEVFVRGRLAFPDLYVARQFEGKGPFSYSATVLMEKGGEDSKLVVAAIRAVAKDKWLDKADQVLKGIVGNNQKCCFYDGDTKEYDGFPGHDVLSAKRPQDNGYPKVVDTKVSVELRKEDGKPYGGCYVRMKVDIWAQDNQWGKGIRATLIAVQFLKHGDAFTAAGPATTDGFNDEEEDSSGLL